VSGGVDGAAGAQDLAMLAAGSRTVKTESLRGSHGMLDPFVETICFPQT
jgi:hypothetical protein